MINIDTHSAFKKFIAADVPEKQAEIIINFVNESISKQHFISEKEYADLVTKTDLLEIKSELKLEINEVRTEIEKAKNSILYWMIPFFLTNIGLVIAVLLKLT